jgi:hypothetical protein
MRVVGKGCWFGGFVRVDDAGGWQGLLVWVFSEGG